MTSDEARDRFSAAYDGLLGSDERAAFEAALAADDALRSDYEELRVLLDEAHALGEEEVAVGDAGLRALVDRAHEVAVERALAEDEPDLLGGVQARLRARSRGRFYRDRFSQKTGLGALFPILVGLVMLVVLGISWLLVHEVEVEAADGEARSGENP